MHTATRPQPDPLRLCATHLLAVTLQWLVLVPAASARTDGNAHFWSQYSGDHPIGSSLWGVHLEAQIRRHDSFRAPQNLLPRPAANFLLHPKVELTAGYG